MGSAFFVPELTPRVRGQLLKFLPDLPPWHFEHALAGYIAARDDPAPTPATVRKELDALAAVAADLASRLAGRSDGLADYLAVRELRHGAQGLTYRLVTDLRILADVASMARRDADADARPGRKVEPRTLLINELADALLSVGLPVNDQAKGPLALAVSIAIEAADESPLGDLQGTVKSALAQRRNKGGQTG